MGISVYTDLDYWKLDYVFRRKGEVRYDSEKCEVWCLRIEDIFKGKQRGNIGNLIK